MDTFQTVLRKTNISSKSSETYPIFFLNRTKKKFWKKMYIKKTSLYIFFFVIKCSETYAQKILWSALFEGGREGSAYRYLGQSHQRPTGFLPEGGGPN